MWVKYTEATILLWKCQNAPFNPREHAFVQELGNYQSNLVNYWIRDKNYME